MEEKLEKQYIQTIRVPVNEIQWYKKNKEIIISGKLFDIKSVTIKNQVALFKGIFDEKETIIKDQIVHLQQQKKNKDNNNPDAKFVSIVLFQENFLTLSNQYYVRSLETHNRPQNDIFKSTFPSTPAPPPKGQYCTFSYIALQPGTALV
jgi:hypothetical protein